MNHHNTRQLIACAALVACALPALAVTANDTPGNLVKNGSLNSTAAKPAYATPDNWNSILPLGAQDSSGFHYNWTGVTTQGANTPRNVTNTTDPDYIAGSSEQALFIQHSNGYILSDGTQGISQQIDGLVLGHTYELTFATASASANIQAGGYWQVSFLGLTKNGPTAAPGIINNVDCWGGNYDCQGPGGTVQSSWVTSPKVTFTANSTSSLLKFAAYMPPTNNPQNFQFYLDDVVLVDTAPAPVPEMSTLAMLAVGLGAVSRWTRRRAKAAKA